MARSAQTAESSLEQSVSGTDKDTSAVGACQAPESAPRPLAQHQRLAAGDRVEEQAGASARLPAQALKGARAVTDERGKFVLKLDLKKRAPVVRKVPKVHQLLVGDAARIVPSDAIRRKLGDTALVVGVDIETADWIDRRILRLQR